MSSLSAVVFLVLWLHMAFLADACPPRPPPICRWTTCYNVWNGWYPSGISPGRCVWQYRTTRTITYHHSRRGGCPSSQRCYSNHQRRVMCSCRYAYHCPLRHWSGWGGVSQGTCRRQSRYRDYNEHVSYIHRAHSCSGVRRYCGSRQYQHRQWCSCRHAYSCPLQQWSGWSGTIPQGHCNGQTRYRYYREHVRYIQQSNCHGVSQTCGSGHHENRRYCSCRYAHCSLGGWSSWSDTPSSVNQHHCASQKRSRRYSLTWKYDMRLNNCQGVVPQSCPSTQHETREKIVKCLPLALPQNGAWDRDECSKIAQVCKATCMITCDEANGFKAEGATIRSCGATGQWSTPWNTYCKDILPPSLKCPDSIVSKTDPGKPTARITIPSPEAVDNSGDAPVITHDVGVAVKDFPISGKPHVVRYTARDKAGNAAVCSLYITVKDKERPKVTFCPDDIHIETNKNSERVTWLYPTFVDNSLPPDQPIRVTSNRNPGVRFHWGKYQVKYTAFDQANNNATCEFYVQVSPVKCPLFDPPQHGTRACNKKTQGANGISHELVCSVQCKTGYAFAEFTPSSVYMCQSDGKWYRMIHGFPVPVFDQKKRPWPDCAPKTGVTSTAKSFTFYTGSCIGNHSMTLDQIRQNFLHAIRQSMMANVLLCQESQGVDCVVENVKVYCGARSKRSGSDEPQRVITFDFVINDKKPQGDRAKEATKLQSMMKELDMAESYIKTSFPSNAHMPTLKIEASGSSLFCPPKSALVVPEGSGSELQKAICVECPVGTFYDEATRNCSICPVGTYQDEMGQTKCKECPLGTLTIEAGARNATMCYDTCEPGEYRHIGNAGAATCLACPLGTYQPKAFSASCIKCPDVRTTARVGSTSLSDCK
ncbi:sushi, von Willebrand factor type A, EGF and pentraxin domain-containing protein 1 [Nematostella vectensis]|uniref:sushi, von Willebrand factor type A, EGF and pentraxin domain-containing protein 1 n=1 Tax=Nematostella vectensis TaxID=45351 RepID=UPI00207750DF|nr:sushi, von Willebrand factor type A, EGF and pentraxin domain-containing protein 1 [Nematostella vectensis]